MLDIIQESLYVQIEGYFYLFIIYKKLVKMANGLHRHGMNGLVVPPKDGLKNGLKPIYSREETKYGGRKIRKVSDSDYIREVSISKAPDTFPCGHVLCHQCIRRHMVPSKDIPLSCPLCGKPANRIYTSDPGTSLGYNVEDVDNITLLSNFDDMIKKFDGINYAKRRLHKETVQSRSLAMSFTNTDCHLCQEQHGTLQVLQEFNELQVAHLRPELPANMFYRLSYGEIVTSFYSDVNSCCICVPCTYKELRGNADFPQLRFLSDNEATQNPRSVLAEVGKIIAKNSAPLETLHGKNVIEIEHKLKLNENALEFDFNETAARIKRMVNDQEQNLIKLASYRIQDKGGVYHIQGSNSIEQNTNESVIW